jgi:hypothetical protein
MSEPEDQAPEAAPEATEKRPVKQRPKMALGDQAVFLGDLLRRCRMHSGPHKGAYAGEASLCLSEDDMLRIETIQQTLLIFDMEGAAELVRKEMWRKRQGGNRR